ncbi:copper binding protein [groundwater metagenome]
MWNKSCSLVLILLSIALSGCLIGFEQPTNATPNQTTVTPTSTPEFAVREPSTVYVNIRGSAFDPLELKVVNGTTVKWENFDNSKYAINVNNVSSPPFDKRESWSYRFNETGTFEYNCSIHPWMTHGRIVVE